MVDLVLVSSSFSIASALVSFALLIFALRAYSHTRDGNMAFLVGAFALFAFKSLIVGYALLTNAIEHDSLELVDGAGDLCTVLLMAMPLLVPRREHEP